MATATFTEKEQNWQEESTIYWFNLEGTDNGTNITFGKEPHESTVYGIVESGPTSTVVDEEGSPLTESDHITIAVRNTAKVTDEMRAE